MSDKEKLEAKNNGKDVETEKATVIQSTDFAKSVDEVVKPQEVQEPEVEKPISKIITPDYPADGNIQTTPVEEEKNPVIDTQEATVKEPSLVSPQLDPGLPSVDTDINNIIASLNPTENPVEDSNEPSPVTTSDIPYESTFPFENPTPSYEQPTMASDFDTSASLDGNDYGNYSSNQPISSTNTFNDLASGVELEKVADVVSSVEDAKNLKNATKDAIGKVVDESFEKLEKAMEMLEKADAIFAASEENTPGKHWYDKEGAWRREFRGLREKNKEEIYSSSNVIPFNGGYSDNGYQNNDGYGFRAS